MRINILEGFKNSFNNENNSVSLRIDTDSPLIKHLDIISKNIDEIHDIMHNIIKKIIKQFFIINSD